MAPEDIWSRIGSATPAPSAEPDEWLIRHNGMLLGPVSSTTIINKLLQGEFDGATLLAPDGQDDFLPARQIATFRPHVEKSQRLIASRKRKRMLLIVAVLVFILVPGGVAGAWWTRKQGYWGKRKPTAMVAGQTGKKVSVTDVPDLKLVALVDLDKAQDGLKITRKKPRPGKRPTPGKKPGAPDQMEGPVGCQLQDAQIFGVVKRSLSRWLVCVQNLADNQPDAVPSTLHLGFTVTTSGSLKDFKIHNRHLRKGPFRNCMFKFFDAMKFPSSKGSNCTVDDWPIPLKK